MKYYELDNNEKQTLNEFEKGTWRSTKHAKRQKSLYQDYAQNTLNKTKNINIRVPEKDLLKIKAQAAEKGIPYQTLVASVLHQYSNGQLQE